ncbi:LA2681 family HEPN domain-containing protein [Shewanella sp. SP2S2-6]|uniref:LA2681 family HEPN domain-containing protein n=1 Tax=Shewanella sp. SP2S2-6 TaxID=3063540 RepID=UPI002892515A|nr:LA2681 family HEPN domain-containing protein [Shewanella sp. SP2S2-6]MDT3297420.1 LA2681 family HEPN domain-containing protein [Shewanella sp. SP2S2-6]
MLNKETEDLGLEIDIAFDNNDISKLEVLLVSCDSLMENETSENYSVLYFYKANCYAALRMIERKDVDDTWSWHQERLVAEILNLRKALAEPGFEKLHEIIQCKILTNIANGMSSLGRVIESISYYEEALSRIDNFAMALGNKAIGQVHYGQHLYDHGHSGIFFFHANKELNRFGSEPLLWDCGIQQDALDTFMGYRDFTEDVLEDIEFDSKFDFNNFSLGKHQKEQDYRRWCLQHKLFINPLNDVFTATIAANDVLHLPIHFYAVGEEPRFPKYFNLLKQEFIVARHMLYEFTTADFEHYSDNDVLLENGLDGVYLGYRNELLKNSLRISYSIFDKIALFLNDYMRIGLKVDSVNFRNIWGTYNKKNKALEINPCFLERENWLLRGLYFLSKDLYDQNFTDVAEPEARELHIIRKMAEHRYLGIQEYPAQVDDTEYIKYITVDDLADKALKMLELSREALIYLSLAMHIEERKREGTRGDGIVVPIQFTHL